MRESHVSFLRYWDTAGKLKNLSQWRAKLNALKDPAVPLEATLACRTPTDAGRVLALYYMVVTEEAISADLKNREHRVTQELRDWMA